MKICVFKFPGMLIGEIQSIRMRSFIAENVESAKMYAAGFLGAHPRDIELLNERDMETCRIYPLDRAIT